MTGKLKALPGGTAARTYAEVLKGLPNTTENADGTLATPELSAIEPYVIRAFSVDCSV